MRQRVLGVLRLAACGLDRHGWATILDLKPWRIEGQPVNRTLLRVQLAMKSERAASALWLAWSRRCGATVAVEIGRIETVSGATFAALAQGRPPIARAGARLEEEAKPRRRQAIEIAGLGALREDDEGNLRSKLVPVPLLGGRKARFVIQGYAEDPAPTDFARAVRNLLGRTPAVLAAAARHAYRYYDDCRRHDSERRFPRIASPADVWSHVRFGDEWTVSRRASGTRRVCASLECNCDWEREHGLQLVLERGLRVTKLGPFDGHLSNADAYADPRLERVVYRSID